MMGRPEGPLPRGQWIMEEGDDFLSFSLNKIADRSLPNFSHDLVNKIIQTSNKLGQLKSSLKSTNGWTGDTIVELLESTISSQIEGTSARAEDVVMYRAGHSVSDDTAVLASNNLDVLKIFRKESCLSIRSFEKAVQELFKEHESEGEIRKSEVWVAGTYAAAARYVAPHHLRVEELLQDLLDFSTQKEFNPLIRAMIAHAQFELIHPFTDGNGRVGRALFVNHLERFDILPRGTILLSNAVRARQQEYNRHLSELSEGGDWDSWCQFFIEIIDHAADLTLHLINRFEEEKNLLEEALLDQNASRTAMRMAKLITERPWFDSKIVSRKLGISIQQANNLINLFHDSSIIVKASEAKRLPLYQFVGAIKVLDEVNSMLPARHRPTE